MKNLTTSAKFTRVKNAVAGGFGDTITTNSIDMKGYSAVTFVVALGACADTSAGIIKAQQSGDDGAVDTFADLLGTGIVCDTTSDNKLVLLEITDPQERYIRVAVARATANIVIDSIVAIQTTAGVEPVTQSATVLASELHASPAEGTA